MKKYQLEIIVFLCGALCMMLELVAARVLSPYVGSSNLIWTIIIGIMLISMSVGYWIGGKLADKKPNLNILSSLLLAGAIYISTIPILETIIVRNLSIALSSLVVVAMISAILLFGVPSFILTTVSPYAVKLKDKEKNNDNIGKVSGRISSVSTIGSIVGTFVAGFILIPTFGVRTIILGISIVLIILSVFLFDKKNIKYFCLIAIISISVIGLNYMGKYLFERENPSIIQDTDSEYSRIWVREIQKQGMKYKTLQVDTGLESHINQETGEMGAEYLKYYDLFLHYISNAENTLMIGGAAYTYPMHYLREYENKKIDVVEIDEKMTKIAEEEFALDRTNPNLQIYHQDGRSYLNKTDKKYDAIFIDAFKGLNAPFELTTYEAMQNAKNALNENGVVITNVISSLEGEESDFIKYEYATYKRVFDEVKIFAVDNKDDKEDRQNLILIGIKGKVNTKTKNKEFENLLKNEITDYSSDKKIVTDNYAPIGT